MIDFSQLFSRQPKSEKHYDVIVAGGGPAGIGAALASAINGASTLILEGRSQFGGTATAGMWMNFNWIFRSNEEDSRGGIHQLLIDRIRSFGPAASCPGRRDPIVLNDGGNLDIHPEYFKKVIFDLFDEYQIDYSLYAPIVGVVKDGSHLTGVQVGAKEGGTVYHGSVIIDATGDGDVAYLAGCDMENSNPAAGWRAPITLLFALCNVDTDRFYDWYRKKPAVLQGREFSTLNEAMVWANSQGYAVPIGFSVDRGTLPGVLNFNFSTTRDMFLDGTRSYDLTVVEKLGVLQATELVRLGQDWKIPGLENAGLMRTGGFAAVRETRRLIGEYIFTEKDLMEGTDFPDAIASKYGGRDPMGDAYPNTNICQGALYPYRSLLPKEVDGLLVAGRCGSASFQGHYGGKSMGNMLAIGQAAGCAAALCAQNNVVPRALDYKLIQQKLKDMGVIL